MLIKKCRVCDSKKLKKVISLGSQPLANNLLITKEEKFKKFPLDIMFCSKCCNSQLSISINSKKMFDNYLYKSSISKDLVLHFEKIAKKIKNIFKINLKNDLIIDVGSNDGIFLKACKKIGYQNLIGIEPAKNLANESTKNGFKIINDYLNQSTVKKINQKAKIISASNVFAHVSDLNELTRNMIELLDQNGIIIIEIQYLPTMIDNLIFDNIYHEHVNYWSLISLINFFKKFKFKVFNCEKINTHGGSLRVYVCNETNKRKASLNVTKLMLLEKKKKINKYSYYKNFNKKINIRKKKIFSFLIKNKKKNIIGYGAPAKATVAINFYKISNFLKYIVDDNPLKRDKIVPGTNLIIKDKISNKEDIVIIFAWNYFNKIKNKIKNKAYKILNLQNF